MKKFSDLQDIDKLSIRIHVAISHRYESQPPRCSLRINQRELYNNQIITNDTGAVFHVGLLDAICIEVELHEKDYNQDHTTAVILKSVVIENIDLVPGLIHHARYINDHNFNQPTTELGFNGIWQFFIDEPFYQWHHRVTGQGWLLKPQH